MLSQEVNDYERSTTQYFKDLKNIKSIKKNEEFELFRQYYEEHNEGAKKIILQSNLKFVITIAKQYKGRGVPFNDLISEGNIGLIKAFNKFDYKRGIKFISYAVWWIKQSILSAIENGNNLPAEELPSEYENYDIHNDNENIKQSQFNSPFEDKEGKYDAEYECNLKYIINTLTSDLNQREKEIFELYYGLNNKKTLTLEEIGNIYGLTKERVRQINEKSLKKVYSKALLENITIDVTR